ncbi:MAG: hypothetical protein Q4A75_09390 [Peptostreptococcaceae bacterium]|nr:hypothetical protein [Peptostreptococcaceae bacterium]
MKLNKKLAAGALASLMMVSSFAMAAPDKKNLVATYGVVLRVNGSNFAVTDSSMRPFITQDGRTYVSIAALNQMGIATAAYDKASKTVSVNSSSNNNVSSGNVAQLQAQVQSQTAEISRLQYENNQLKAEIEKLKGSSSTTDNKKKDTGTKELSDLSSSEKRTLVKDLEGEIKYLRANTRFDRSQKFNGQVNISSRAVEVSLYPYTGTFTKEGAEGRDWNARVGNKRDRENLEDDYASFVESEVRDMIKGVLKDYKGYNINLTIYTDSNMRTSMVEADYNYSKDRGTASVFEIK